MPSCLRQKIAKEPQFYQVEKNYAMPLDFPKFHIFYWKLLKWACKMSEAPFRIYFSKMLPPPLHKNFQVRHWNKPFGFRDGQRETVTMAKKIKKTQRLVIMNTHELFCVTNFKWNKFFIKLEDASDIFLFFFYGLNRIWKKQ